tara:strand:+ start:39 stop:281 length:243 start_codon:yes stop_codon:yes gene_type:complete
MKTSNFMSLNWLDLGKGFLVGFIAFALDFLQKVLVPSLDISAEVKVMILAAIGYLIKNFFTPADGQKIIGTPIPPKPKNG